jgi:hypothetical protein
LKDLSHSISLGQGEKSLGFGGATTGGRFNATKIFDADKSRFRPSPRLDENSLPSEGDSVEQARESRLGLSYGQGFDHPTPQTKLVDLT